MDKIRIMRPNNGTEEDISNPNYVGQNKWDGTYCLLFKDGDDIKLIGRSWKSDYADLHPEIVEEAKMLIWDKCVLAGELCFFDNTGKDHFLTALATKETWEERELTVKYMVFDIVRENGQYLYDTKFIERDIYLDMAFNSSHMNVFKYIQKTPTAVTEQEKMDMWNNSNEGIVLKHVDSVLTDGRTSQWKKVKNVRTADFWCIGVTEGKGRRESTFGAMLLATKTGDKYKYNPNDIFTYVGKTSGFTDEQLEHYTNNLVPIDKSKIKLTEPKTNKNKLPKDVKFFCVPDTLVEVKYQRWTEYDMLLMPRFIKERDDLQK